jgi:hypothetical protein
MRSRALQQSVAAAIAATIAIACQKAQPTVVLLPENENPVSVTVEVADTPETRSRGLMYRTTLEEDQGMIFLFEDSEDHSFWMKNTPLPLDMIFISSDGRIAGIAENTEPFSLKPVHVGAQSRAVLEVRGGFSQRHGLRAGDRVEYRNIASRLLP